MPPSLAHSLVAFAPELYLATTSLILVLLAAWRGKERFASITLLASVALIFTAIMLAITPDAADIFNGFIVRDSIGRLGGVSILVIVAIVLFTGNIRGAGFGRRRNNNRNQNVTGIISAAKVHGIDHAEYPALALLMTLGMLIMIAASDMMVFYVGLEMQSLALYVMTALDRDNPRASEAGLKYFTLGSIASAVLLYGISLLYGTCGATNYGAISSCLLSDATTTLSTGAAIALVLVLGGIAFKIAAAPFHMWAPDVYEGAPIPIMTIIASASKIVAFAAALRMMTNPFANISDMWQPVLAMISVVSMLWGSIAGITQTSIKRLIAYSAVANAGFMLLGVAVATSSGTEATVVYLALYSISILGILVLIGALQRDGKAIERIDDLAGLARTHPATALMMTLLVISLAGVPPLAGFLGKYMVFKAVVQSGFMPLALVGAVTSIIAAFYYLRLIRAMYVDGKPQHPLDDRVSLSARIVGAVASAAVLVLMIAPDSLLHAANSAAVGLIVR